ncbi:odorant receptor Or2-like isoform X1 [Cylas formicarius]|uniref:odorant receptor Or2-like isoform X1 n=1 Tax=Cylas formicarius TaxID=197179 RepID=UPI00295851CC|nr:odorant receptor Or2-like isoform X1 [Cylas formicarius]
MFIVCPFIDDIVQPLGYSNDTGVWQRHEIFPNWFPFDRDRYYVTAYVLQFAAGCLGYTYIVHGGALFISLLTFSVGQFKIIQHVYSNLSRYAKALGEIGTARSEEIIAKALSKEHQLNIRFVNEINHAMQWYIFLDFSVSSFQLAVVVFQLLQSTSSVEIMASCSYFCTLSTQLFLLYWNGHEIVTQHENIAECVYKSDWPSYDAKTTRIMQMTMVRAQKPLKLNIGPLGYVKVDALIQIFKTIYSYVCLITGNWDV